MAMSELHRTVTESTPATTSLHAANCGQSAEDLQRMRDLIQKDSSLVSCSVANITTAPLWDACQAQHPRCVKLILEASTPENIKLQGSFIYDVSMSPPRNVYQSSWSRKVNILSCSLIHGRDTEQSCEIVELLLQHGISPSEEFAMSEIYWRYSTQYIVLETHYKVTKLIFPSHAVHLAVQESYSKILELFLEHGAYPEPVILTDSGTILPLFPTVGRHFNPIPHFYHKIIQSKDLVAPYSTLHHHATLKTVKCLKTLLLHGASLPPYFVRPHVVGSNISPHVLYPFQVIIRLAGCGTCKKATHAIDFNILRPKFHRGVCAYYDIMLEILTLYHQFGGSLWCKIQFDRYVVPCEGKRCPCRNGGNNKPCRTIIDVLREQMRADPEAQNMVEVEVRRMMSTPPSLKHAARLAIRRAMGYGYVKNLETLPVHQQLKEYLKFETE